MNFIKKWATVVPLCLSLSCATVYGETPVSGEYASFAIGTSGNDENEISTASNISTSHMGSIYGGDKTTAVDLKFEYKDTLADDDETQIWKAKFVRDSSVTYTAQVTCLYEDGLLNDYDQCKITVMPPSGSCCFASVYNSKGKADYTDLAVGQLQSSLASVKHTGTSVTFKIVFGQYEE